MKFGGTVFCFMGVSYFAFWLVMVIWRCVRSRRGDRIVSWEPVDGVASSDTGLEGDPEILAMERVLVDT